MQLHLMRSHGQKDPITCYLNFLDIYVESKDFDPAQYLHPNGIFTRAGSQWSKDSKGRRISP